jgi:hypothetical protein
MPAEVSGLQRASAALEFLGGTAAPPDNATKSGAAVASPIRSSGRMDGASLRAREGRSPGSGGISEAGTPRSVFGPGTHEARCPRPQKPWSVH